MAVGLVHVRSHFSLYNPHHTTATLTQPPLQAIISFPHNNGLAAAILDILTLKSDAIFGVDDPNVSPLAFIVEGYKMLVGVMVGVQPLLTGLSAHCEGVAQDPTLIVMDAIPVSC